MADNTQGKRGPGRPPGSRNKSKNKASAPPVTNAEKIEQMQARYDRDRRNLDVIWSITFFALGLFLFFTVVMDTTGSFGRAIHDVCLGMFGSMAYVLPFFILMCLSTVYIYAHYAVDVMGGLVTGVAFYFLLVWCFSYTATEGRRQKR